MAEALVPTNLAIFGSCVSRDPFTLRDQPPMRILSYLARQSFVGWAGRPLPFDAEWYAGMPDFERRCITANLGKGSLASRLDPKARYLLVDYIDERFELLRAEGTYVCDTRQLYQPGFAARYPDAEHIPRLGAATTRLWREGAARFFDEALRIFPPERIILHEAVWAPAFLHSNGDIRPFGHPLVRQIERHNDLLEDYFAITQRLVPRINSIRVPPSAVFADPEHRWSKEPFHYVGAYYTAFLEQLSDIVARTAVK